MKNEKKKGQWQQWLVMGIFVLIGAVCGILMIEFTEQTAAEETSSLERMVTSLTLLLGLYVSFFLHTCLHEAGHLVFGLRTGYRFSSFRIGSMMWLKENGKLVCRRFHLAGTGGQCLMAPPDMQDGKFPVVLYNLGGCIMNLLVSAVFFAIYLFVPNTTVLSVFCLMMVLIGVVSALINGIPLRMGPIDNDGYNAFALQKDPDAMAAFWVQLKVNEQITNGIRTKDMPEAWFTVPSDEKMKNSMVATQGVFAANRFMDQHKFEEADRLMAHLLTHGSGIVGVHRSLMICDRMYLELIGDNRREVLDEMRTKEQLDFMKAMKHFPTVVRTEYVYALLGLKDAAKAHAYRALFERIRKTYPYAGDMALEQELVEIAEKVADAV
ncbi:MAG: M50 family metallopeptidase [Ruminococcaceae bacterium]|nr:M50 family metallopeptidase [Oscillospiraceae bacterium]